MPAPDLPAGGRKAVFVYYRLPLERIPALRRAFVGLASAGPWRGQLMRKIPVQPAGAGDDDHLQTWMEVYWLAEDAPPEPQVLQRTIERCAQAAGIAELIEGERHYEVFEACA
jgi:hypothetical protein